MLLCCYFPEEVFSSDHTLWWSPDSQKILFATFYDSEVERYSFPKYGDPDQQYDSLEVIPYPKVRKREGLWVPGEEEAVGSRRGKGCGFQEREGLWVPSKGGALGSRRERGCWFQEREGLLVPVEGGLLVPGEGGAFVPSAPEKFSGWSLF